MKMEDAQAVATMLSAKLKSGETLTPEEQQAYKNSTDFLDSVDAAAKEYAQTKANSMAVEDRVNSALGRPIKLGFWTPGRRIAAEVVGGIAIAAISVFGGMRLERSRANRRNNDGLFGLGSNIGDGVGQHHVDSPQSHPAQSPDDGRLAQNRDQRGGNQGGANQRGRQTANA